MRYPISNLSRQKGAVLLLFALLLLLGSTYSLVSKLNSETNYYTRQSKQTQESLRLAKQALIGYALTYPEEVNPDAGPGYLPCPDRDNNGLVGTGTPGGGSCSSGGNTTIGRFPYKRLETPDLRDASGARLWYVLSDNYRNNPRREPLNSETAGQLTVDGKGDIVAVIIAPGAPIGNQNRNPADTNILTEITNYLELANTSIAPMDFNFISVDPDPTNFTDFNDRLITITRKELMEKIEKRILGEVKTVLSGYKTAPQVAYPWLTPFVDPKTSEKRLTGKHSGSNDQATGLTDSSADFTQWGVAIGDVVWNITDGSYGLVTAFTATTLTIGGGLTLGSENDFDTDDEYYVDIAAPVFATPFIGTAAATSGSGLVLTDTNQDFDALGVQIGDILENVTDGSSGVIETVTSTQLTVSSLSGGTNDVFASSNIYRIRTSMGRATSAGGLTLNDTNVDFTDMGIQVGDLVHNVTDGSIGIVSVAPTASSLTVAELNLGTNNTFSNNDYYVIPRYNSSTNTREGLLPLHESGEVFHTSFSIDWGAQAADGSIVVSTEPATDPKPQYANTSSGIKEWVERSRSNNSGTITVSETEGLCTWVNSTIAECKGTYTDVAFLSGTATSVTTPEPADGNEYFYDTTKDFDDAGVDEGDKVENLTNGTKGLVDSASSTGIHFTNIGGETDFSISTGDSYRISIATKRIQNTADAATDPGLDRVYDGELNTAMNIAWRPWEYATIGSGGLVLVDSSTDFIANGLESGKLIWNGSIGEYFIVASVDSATQLTLTNAFAGTGVFSAGNPYLSLEATSAKLKINDTVVENTSGSRNDGLGFITAFGYNYSLGGYWFETNALRGGAHADIHSGDSYRIFYDYVDRREYEFNVRINGNSLISSPSADRGFNEITTGGVRQREICLGHGADCAGSGSDTTIPGDGVTAMVTIRDYNSSTVLVGDATTTVPSAGAQGRIKVSGINFFLSKDYDSIAEWFFNNNWHQLTYVAYSAADAPVAVGACPGANCLIINGIDNTGAPVVNSNNTNALLIAAGMEINTTQDSNCNAIPETAQDRSNGTINEYYESANCSAGDDDFQEQFETNTFNDQIRVIDP